ncbi:HD domain-containing protein [Lentzea sp. NPDC058450]|uniref:HD domain-containing protein n=1 Tax=Lentzea sp. NPDC058450 TaxID=3346505 RepID=UPI00365B6A0D
MPTLHQALTEGSPRRLPAEAEELLTDLHAPPRLAAHLRAVHDVACELLTWLTEHHPSLTVDQEAVRYGAATHDIGKVLHPNELSGPGSDHEPAGHTLLLSRGVPPHLARFAGTHGSWTADGITLEDLLVSLADKVWKAKRVPDLEQRVTDHLATAGGQEPWEVYLALDDELNRIAESADARLAFQSSYPTTP